MWGWPKLERGSKKLNPEFSRISAGGSISEMSIGSIDLDMSSTENGMQQPTIKSDQNLLQKGRKKIGLEMCFQKEKNGEETKYKTK